MFITMAVYLSSVFRDQGVNTWNLLKRTTFVVCIFYLIWNTILIKKVGVFFYFIYSANQKSVQEENLENISIELIYLTRPHRQLLVETEINNILELFLITTNMKLGSLDFESNF